MSLSFWMVLVPTACYAIAAVAYGIQKNLPLAIVYAGYSVANIGLLMLDRAMAK
jgi:hypothetical protein